MEERTLFLRPPLWLPVLLAVILGGAYVLGSYVETRDMSELTITVTGEGNMSAAPDIAALSFGVNVERVPTSQGAMEQLNTQMDAIITAVKEAGIEEKSIRTQSLNLYPAYDWREGEQIPRGFSANQNLVVKVHDVSMVSKVLSAATTAGANQIGNVSFTIDDTNELRDAARKDAIADAKQKAQALAADLGKTLGELKMFNEGYGGIPQPMYREAMMMDGVGGGGMPSVPAGEQEVQVTVNLTYELK